jgi:hypothetical protein
MGLQVIAISVKILLKGGGFPVRKFLYFLSCDAPHLQTRLERLAEKGLILSATDGLFTGEFEETRRQDVRYLVVPYGNQKNAPRTEDFSSFGWALAGGFNGMAIFISKPCVKADEKGLLDKLEQDGCIHRDRWMPYILLIALLCVIGFLGYRMNHLGINNAWYSSYFGVCTPIVEVVLAALAAANMVTLRSYASAWVHGLTPAVLSGGIFVLLLASLLDESSDKLFFALLLVAIAVALMLTLWRRSRITGGVLTGLCLVVLCVGLVFPNVNRSVGAGKELHYEVAEKTVLQLSDLGDDGELKGSGYEVNGTFLARKTTYWEMSDSGSVSSEVTKCASRSIANEVADKELSLGDWTTERWGWSRDDGKTLLLRSGRRVAIVTLSEAATEDEIATIQERLLGE